VKRINIHLSTKQTGPKTRRHFFFWLFICFIKNLQGMKNLLKKKKLLPSVLKENDIVPMWVISQVQIQCDYCESYLGKTCLLMHKFMVPWWTLPSSSSAIFSLHFLPLFRGVLLLLRYANSLYTLLLVFNLVVWCKFSSLIAKSLGLLSFQTELLIPPELSFTSC